MLDSISALESGAGTTDLHAKFYNGPLCNFSTFKITEVYPPFGGLDAFCFRLPDALSLLSRLLRIQPGVLLPTVLILAVYKSYDAIAIELESSLFFASLYAPADTRSSESFLLVLSVDTRMLADLEFDYIHTMSQQG